MGGGGKRVGRAAEHLRPSAQDGTQGKLGPVALAHLQQARGKVGARQRILRTQAERVAEGIGSCRVFAVKQQRPPEFCQDCLLYTSDAADE